MRKTVLRVATLLVLVAPFLAQARNPTDLDYARYLVREGDYIRAAGTFKRLAFFAQQDSTRLAHLLWTGRCERWAGNSMNARRFLQHVKEYSPRNSMLRNQASLELGIVNLSEHGFWEKWRREESTESPVLEQYATFFSVASLFYHGEWETAESTLSQMPPVLPKLIPLASSLQDQVHTSAHAKTRNPGLAALASAVIPGLGQCYSDHPVDGIQAFLLVGALGLGTIEAYQYDMHHQGSPGGLFAVSASITALFHVANIYGAAKTATYYNWKMRHDAFDKSFHDINASYREYLIDEANP